MGLFGKLFGKKSPLPKNQDAFTPIYGGDALSPQTAAIVNCASMPAANRLIDRFISERHGQKDIDWNRGIEFFVNDPGIPEFTVRAFGVTLKSDKNLTYFFNVSQPINATKDLIMMMKQKTGKT